MSEEPMETQFLPAKRSSKPEIDESNALLEHKPYLAPFLDRIPASVVVIDGNRQIVLCNLATLRLAGVKDLKDILGLRIGEMMKCIHASETEGGCGTTEFCRQCGAARAILSSQQGAPDSKECRINVQGGESMDLAVSASPLVVDDKDLTLFSVRDTTDEKRRNWLERVFLHDIMNTVSALSGAAELIKMATPGDKDKLGEIVVDAGRSLLDDINMQRQLSAAETGVLQTKPVSLNSLAMLRRVKDVYEKHEVAKDKTVVLEDGSEEVSFVSDETLLSRVLGNMVKNALEASSAGQTVRLKSECTGNAIRFSVRNDAFIPREVQLQIFQRSFSTKDANRGLGTHSMRLLSEKYLGGKVHFTSSSEDGTTFYATYPLNWGEELAA